MCSTGQRLVFALSIRVCVLLLVVGPIRLCHGQDIPDAETCAKSNPLSVCLQQTDAAFFDGCINMLRTDCYYQGDKVSIAPRDDLGGPNATLRSNGGSIVCQADGTCGEQPIPNRDTNCGICKSCTYKNCCHQFYTDPGRYCPIPGARSPDYNAVQPGKYVKCNRDGTCSDQADAPGWDTCCGTCASCEFKGCCHCSFTDPKTWCPIPGNRRADYRGNNRNFVNCKEDGTCKVEDTPKTDTCCGGCHSCTYNGCCHCSYTDPKKTCPIPGWRSPQYAGSDLVPRGSNDPGHCGDPSELMRMLVRYADALYALYRFIGLIANPYRRVPWTDVMDVPNPNRPFPEVGYVQMRRIENHPNDVERPEFLFREIRPQDMHERSGGFTSAQRQEGFVELQGDFTTDEAGHIVANTMGGPDNSLNFFPQHAAVNANRGARWILDSWVDMENRIRQFLNTQTVPLPGQANNRRVELGVYLIYGSEYDGRAREIAYSALFYNGNTLVDELSGRVYNSGLDGNGVQATCPKPTGGSG